MPAFTFMMEALLLIVALSLDAFVASFSYGVNQIKIPVRSCVLMNAICSALLGVSMLIGNCFGTLLPAWAVKGAGFGLLLVMGLVKLFDGVIKAWIAKHKHAKRQIQFRFFSLHMILQIYADATEADSDASRSLSVKEAAGLAVALSFDSLAAGFGAGIQRGGISFTILLSFLAGVLCVFAGERLGKKISYKLDWDISWLSGVLLIVLAVLKL